MNIAMSCWLFAIPLLGLMTGARTMTPIAVLCWFGYAHRMPIHHSWAFWATYLVTAVAFTVGALGEYVGDKLPMTPNRTAIFPLLARIAFGGVVGAIAATSLKGEPLEGVLLGAASAYVGTYLSFRLRHYFTKVRNMPDLPIALVEDISTVCVSLIAMLIITG